MPDLSVAHAVALDYEANAGAMMDEKAAIVITVDPDKPPGARIKDFVPSPAKAKQIAETKARLEGLEPERQPHRHGVVLEPNGTFIHYTEMDKVKKKRNARMLEIAKKLYNERKAERVLYMQSLKLTQNSTTKEKEDPNKKLNRALKIVKRGHPMTKKKALEIAQDQIVKEMRSKR